MPEEGGPDVWEPEGRRVQQIDVPMADPGRYRVEAALLYRKVDQYLINFLLGEDSGLTAPVVEMHRVWVSVDVGTAAIAAAAGG